MPHTLFNGVMLGTLLAAHERLNKLAPTEIDVVLDEHGNYTNVIVVRFNDVPFRITIDECEEPTVAEARIALEQMVAELTQS